MINSLLTDFYVPIISEGLNFPLAQNIFHAFIDIKHEQNKMLRKLHVHIINNTNSTLGCDFHQEKI